MVVFPNVSGDVSPESWNRRKAIAGGQQLIRNRMLAWRTASGAYLAASLAHVGFLARVDSRVDGEGRALDELFVAAGMFTHVGSYSGVDAFWSATRQPL